MYDREEWKMHVDNCKTEKISIKGGDGQNLMAVLVKPSNMSKNCCASGSPVLINCHGGCGYSGSASMETAWSSRVASTCQIVVINVDYRLAPEFQYEDSQKDIVATIEYFYDNASKYGLNKNKFGICGTDIGASYAMAAAIRLMREKKKCCQNKSNILKMMILLAPQVSDNLGNMDIKDVEWWEHSLHKHALEPLKLLTKDFDTNKDDPLFFPAKLEPEELKKLPPTVL